MRNYPNIEDKDWYEDEMKELESLKAKPWQIDALKTNPDYCAWGVYEDYMSSGDSWDKPVIYADWKSNAFSLDDLNELVNFYFEIDTGPTLSLTLWMLHPRKGCSRGVLIENLEEEDMPAVYAYLQEAAKRNANRFSKIQPKTGEE